MFMSHLETRPMPDPARRFPRRISPRSLVIPGLLILMLAVAGCSAASPIFQNAGEDLKGEGSGPAAQPADGRFAPVP
jgi:hypothetical protein